MSAQTTPVEQKNLIEIADVNKYYGTNHVLKNINLSVGKGEVVILLGPFWFRQVNSLPNH